MRSWIARLGALSLLLPAPTGAIAQLGAARQTCAADIKQLCPEVKPGDNRLKACVKAHRARHRRGLLRRIQLGSASRAEV